MHTRAHGLLFRAPSSTALSAAASVALDGRYRLHHDNTNSIEITEDIERARLQKIATMNEKNKPPKLPAPETKRK